MKSATITPAVRPPISTIARPLCRGTAASDCQCHRNHREDGCHTCHQNRSDTGRTCLNERCPQIHRGAILVDRIHVENTVIYNSSDTYSSGVYQKFAEQAKTLGLDIVAAEAFTADSKTDFSVQLQKAKDAGAELSFPADYYLGGIFDSCSGKQNGICTEVVRM